MILEDDIILRDDIDLIFEYFDYLPEDWDYLYLDVCFTPPVANPEDLKLLNFSDTKWINLKDLKARLQWDNGWGLVSSGAYALNRKGMELYLKEFESDKVINNSDMLRKFYIDIENNPLNSYTTNKRLFAVPNEMNTLFFDNNTFKRSLHEYIISGSIETTLENFKYQITDSEKSIIQNLNKNLK